MAKVGIMSQINADLFDPTKFFDQGENIKG